MMILAIDPGPEKSAWVLYEPEAQRLDGFAIPENDLVLDYITTVDWGKKPVAIVIEMVACYGMPVGKDVFDTARWVGQFQQRAEYQGASVSLIYRKDVKLHLCQSLRAKDGNIRQAIIDRFPGTGGGKVPQIGTKKQPGPLYGVVADLWQALGVAITHAETKT